MPAQEVGYEQSSNRPEAAKPAPAELLHYSNTHKVLICKACQYAIQPGALARHLKEIHGIYRGARRPYTTFASGFQLLDPDEVVPPSLDQFPVPHLPLENGLKCTEDGCDHLCASTKRMSAHWSTVHGRPGLSGKDWVPVPLQTFFRGNKLRYFTKPAGPTEEALVSHQHTGPTLEADRLDRLSQFIKCTHNLDPLDVRILQHYFHSTYHFFVFEGPAASPDDNNIWLDAVPRIACTYPFVLHAILASTALHMVHTQPESESTTFKLRAMSHHEAALPLFRRAVDAPTDDNSHAILIFSYLLTIITLAMDVENTGDELLLVNNSGSGSLWTELGLQCPPWLHLIRCGCVMLCKVWDSIENGPFSSLASCWEHYEVLEHRVAAGAAEPFFEFFLSIIPETEDEAWPADTVAIYRGAARTLAECFASVDDRVLKPSMMTMWNVLAVWPMRVDDDYMELLAKRHPGALILLAYYCVILKQLDGMWYFQGRPAKLLTSVMRNLDQKWHPYIQNAIDRVMPDQKSDAVWRDPATCFDLRNTPPWQAGGCRRSLSGGLMESIV